MVLDAPTLIKQMSAPIHAVQTCAFPLDLAEETSSRCCDHVRGGVSVVWRTITLSLFVGRLGDLYVLLST